MASSINAHGGGEDQAPAAAVTEAPQKAPEASPNSCDFPACLSREAAMAVWKENPRSQTFHAWLWESWIKVGGTCPACHRELLTPCDDPEQDLYAVHPLLRSKYEKLRYTLQHMDGSRDMYQEDGHVVKYTSWYRP
ncbi:hypothetical protein VPH35_050518 [Triticum aestivum]